MRSREPCTDPKVLNNRIVEKLLELIEVKGGSWMRRSMARMHDVYECDKNTWVVRGKRRFGDGEAVYVIKFDEERGSFKCTCQEPYKPYAKSRRRACSHIGACLFHHIFF